MWPSSTFDSSSIFDSLVAPALLSTLLGAMDAACDTFDLASAEKMEGAPPLDSWYFFSRP